LVLANPLIGYWHALLARVSRRERTELSVLLVAFGILGLASGFVYVAEIVTRGDTRHFDERLIRALRTPDNPAVPIGPPWLRAAALDITALGSPTVLGLVVFVVAGYLILHGLYRTSAFVVAASCGGWILNWALKQSFGRPRPDLVPHLRDVMSSSFPSGHALTSAAVYLTLGTLLMRLAEGRLAKVYCIFVAMLATLLVGASRVYLGVHYPTDVLAGWLIGLSWALVCWMIERALERRTGLKREQRQYQQEG